jgi:hypothetical protein
LSEWTSLLGGKEIASWFINVVNKADLWHNEEKVVLDHYMKGSYYDALGDVKALNPVTVPYCATIHKFYNIANISGTFDDGERMLKRNNFFRVLLEAIGRGSVR